MSEAEKNLQENPQEETAKIMSPLDVAEAVARGTMKLLVPIEDGENTYEELKYDFTRLTGWELARAIDSGAERGASHNNMTDVQALCLFAAAAAKCTGGLDATDIRDRLSAQDAILGISTAMTFFRGSLLAGSLRITKS